MEDKIKLQTIIGNIYRLLMQRKPLVMYRDAGVYTLLFIFCEK